MNPQAPRPHPSIGQVLVGIDGSPQAANALRWAYRHTEPRGAQVTAVLAWDLLNQHHPDGSGRIDPGYGDQAADAALAHFVVEAIGPEGARIVERRTVCDLPAPGLLAAAADADLLVVGARGLGGFQGLLLGSVSQHCLHHADMPLAVVHGAPTDKESPRRWVVGIDGSPGSAAALAWAMADAAGQDGEVEVVHVWERPRRYVPTPGTALPGEVDTIDARRRLVDDMVARTTAGLPRVRVERTVVGR